MTAALTASKYELALRCIGAFVLPWRDQAGPWAAAGTQRHTEDEAAINAGDIPSILDERWPGYSWRAEVAFALDIATGDAREVGDCIGRNYGEPRTPFERFGTADVVGQLDRALVIVDKKGFEEVTRAAENPQLRFLAAAASRVYRPERIEVAINHELRGLDVAELDAFDLGMIPHQLRQVEIDVAQAMADTRAGRPPAFNTGRWCRWCPAYDACPQQRELAALVRRPDDDVELSLVTAIVDDSDAPAAYQLWKRIGILQKRLGEALYGIAARAPFPIGGGKFFGKHSVLGDREYDGPTVHAVVAEQLGRDVADRVVEMTASQAQFERVVKPLVPRGKFSAAKRSIFGEVERLGKMNRKQTTEISEFTPELQIVE